MGNIFLTLLNQVIEQTTISMPVKTLRACDNLIVNVPDFVIMSNNYAYNNREVVKILLALIGIMSTLCGFASTNQKAQIVKKIHQCESELNKL